MKKLLVASVFSSVLLFGTTVTAAEEGETVDPGTTPDQILYTFDQLLEDLRLAFTFDSEKETDLLIEFAKERLAEAEVMSEEEKTEFIEKAVEDYLAILEETQEQIGEAVLNEEITEEEGLEELTEELEEITDVDGEIEEQLDEEVREELDETIETIKVIPEVVGGFDVQKVTELRESGLVFGQIAQIFYLADSSDKTVEEVAALYSEGKGFGQVSKELGVHPSKIATLRGGKKEAPQEDDEESGTNEEPDSGLSEDEDGVTEDADANAEDDGTEQADDSLGENETTTTQSETTNVTAVAVKDDSKKEVAKLQEEQKKAEALQRLEEKKTAEEQKRLEEQKTAEEKRLKEVEKAIEAQNAAKEKKQNAENNESEGKGNSANGKGNGKNKE